MGLVPVSDRIIVSAPSFRSGSRSFTAFRSLTRISFPPSKGFNSRASSRAGSLRGTTPDPPHVPRIKRGDDGGDNGSEEEKKPTLFELWKQFQIAKEDYEQAVLKRKALESTLMDTIAFLELAKLMEAKAKEDYDTSQD